MCSANFGKLFSAFIDSEVSATTPSRRAYFYYLVEETAASLEDGKVGVVSVSQQVQVVPLHRIVNSVGNNYNLERDNGHCHKSKGMCTVLWTSPEAEFLDIVERKKSEDFYSLLFTVTSTSTN